jgi:ABC1 atypical kinase-like domain
MLCSLPGASYVTSASVSHGLYWHYNLQCIHASRILTPCTYVCAVTGVFNGDPHAGNILLLPDGRLGLIDYGQVKYLTEKERLHLCKVMLCMVSSANAVYTLLNQQ